MGPSGTEAKVCEEMSIWLKRMITPYPELSSSAFLYPRHKLQEPIRKKKSHCDSEIGEN